MSHDRETENDRGRIDRAHHYADHHDADSDPTIVFFGSLQRISSHLPNKASKRK